VGVLASRGPDAVLSRGSTLEMVLDRPVSFEESELDFGGYQPPRRTGSSGADASSDGKNAPLGRPSRRWPL
jgi:type IV secretion system protein VirB10